MKALFALILVGGIALVGVYFFGGTASFDPDQQGRDARGKIKPGMTWQQVIKIAGVPKRMQTIIRIAKSGGETLQPGPAVPFDAKQHERDVKAGAFPHGFVLPYNFSTSVSFNVHFDSTGKVESFSDNTTMADLLDGKLPGGLPKSR
ncbi:hypothetical protein RAS1_04500 [Phycisphaerae bacterium RAS1]|nr:hypothetical protein RAS1_04500 [Phycisphaerae bacterium RAS1]